MKKQISPAAMVGIVLLVVVVIGLIAWKFVFAGPAATTGIGANGQPMTAADANQMAMKMSGGRAAGHLPSAPANNQ